MQKQFPIIPQIHPIKDMKIKNDELNHVMEKKDHLSAVIAKEIAKLEIPDLNE